MKNLIDEGLCASVYTQWSDIEEEVNGVYTYDRKIRKIDRKSEKRMRIMQERTDNRSQ